MALTLENVTRDAMGDALLTLIDSTAGPAILRIREGTTTLVDIELQDPSFTSVNGLLTLIVAGTAPNGTAVATASVAADDAQILTDAAGTLLISGLTVSTSGADVNLSSTAIVSGGTVSLTGGTITVPAS